MHLLKLSTRPWRLAFWTQAFSTLAMGGLLFGLAVTACMELGLAPLIHRLQAEQVITAYLGADLDTKAQSEVADRIRTSLGAKVELVDSGGFLSELRKGRFEELARQLEDLGTEMQAIVPAYVSAYGEFDSRALENVRKIPGVESAESSRDRYHHVVGAFRALRWIVRAIGLGLLIALVTGMIQLGRSNGQIHREAVSLLRLWGAGAMAQRLPSLLSGVIIGSLGGVLAASAWILVGNGFFERIGAFSPMLSGISAAPSQVAGAIAAAGLIFGVVSGLSAKGTT